MMYTAERPLRIALAGNPNCGKTTLFNCLTGSRQCVGNWPGVTVEKKTGTIHCKQGWVEMVDLPGIYSLESYSPEERIAGDFLYSGQVDVVINVVDASNLQRNLYLTFQLLELGLPMVAALNMVDVLEKQGDILDSAKMGQMLGIKVQPVSALKKTGIQELLQAAFDIKNQGWMKRPLLYRPADSKEHDPDCVTAQRRYKAAETITEECVRFAPRPNETLSDRIDSIVTNRFLAIPLFFLVVTLLFFVTFGPPGSFFVKALDVFFARFLYATGVFLHSVGASVWVCSLVKDGILAGIGSVLQFIPQILLLFSFLAILEDSGYMARVAFIMDAPMRRLGLSGRAFVPLIMGFGCTVPAVIGTRILESEKDKRLTVLILPFMSCSAKMPVYSLFISSFFIKDRPLIISLIYMFGILMAVISALFFKNTVLRGDSAAFVMELPPYRFPTIHSVWMRVYQRLMDFLHRAVTVLLCASVIVWLLRSFSPDFYYVTDASKSILAILGGWIAPVFTLCGFADWRFVVALLTGLAAKESVVSTMGILFSGNLILALRGTLTPLSAFSFLLFVLLYTPCVASLSAIRREMGSLKWTLVTVFWQLGTAWYVSAMFYQCALLLQKIFC